MSGSNLLFVFTGSIAAYKACDTVSQLVQDGHQVRVVATASALRFIGVPTLEGLTGQPVLTDLWAEGSAMDHIKLTRWADLVILCPATAHTLNRLAAGLADDLVGALFLARAPARPWLVAPAMNPAMWSHPATQASVLRLQAWGLRFLPIGAGRTACGETGAGRLAEPAAIVAAVASALARPPRRLRVLVTAGGTVEPIDGVRVLTNTSTGYTGALLAAHLAHRGHDVVLLRAQNSANLPAPLRQETFTSFADLDAALTRLLGGGDFDAVVHAAAVGDFRIGTVSIAGVSQRPGTKLSSQIPVLLELRPQPKLIEHLRARSRNAALTVVAFKLTQGAEPNEVQAALSELFASAAPDFIVHNDILSRGDSAETFPATIHSRGGGDPVSCATRRDLAAQLEIFLTSTQPTHAPLP